MRPADVPELLTVAVLPSSRKFCRSSHIICYWDGGQFVFHNYATGIAAAAHPVACEILDFFADWRTVAELHRHFPEHEAKTLDRVVNLLLRRSLLLRSDRALPERERAMCEFDRWNPPAGFFHSATKDVTYTDPMAGTRALRRQARRWPLPSPVKRLNGRRRFALPPLPTHGEFVRVLLERRTWRRFAAAQLNINHLGTLLGLTAGIQHWVTVPGIGDFALKTSPSGGALHPLELYVVVQAVHGLPRGLYHYRPDIHAVELVTPRRRAVNIERYLPTQNWYQRAGALVFFSAVFKRSIWKYTYARAYRAVLIEAGHLCQTFCLVATWLGLAPFCSMALADRPIEKDLGLDGIRESVLYAAGVGVRPVGADRAMKPDGPPDMVVRANARLTRAVKRDGSSRARD